MNTNYIITMLNTRIHLFLGFWPPFSWLFPFDPPVFLQMDGSDAGLLTLRQVQLQESLRWVASVEKSWDSHLPDIQWIGLREILQETMDFPIKYGAFL